MGFLFMFEGRSHHPLQIAGDLPSWIPRSSFRRLFKIKQLIFHIVEVQQWTLSSR